MCRKRGGIGIMIERPRIINVERKSRKCPVCGGEIVDIIYGERETLRVSALNERDARDEATALVLEGRFGLRGVRCVEMGVECKG